MMKPKKNIVTRFAKEQEANTSASGLPNSTSTCRYNETRVEERKNKNRAVPDFMAYMDYKMAVDNLESENDNFQKELAEQRKNNAILISLLDLKDKEITKQKQSINDLEENLNYLEEKNTELTKESNTSQKKIMSLKKETERFKKKNTLLQSDIQKLKVQNEKEETLLQTARTSCKDVFYSKVYPNFVQANSNLITDVVKLYELCSHGDKTRHCPAIQYMKSAPEPITSTWHVEDIVSDDGPSSKKRKMDNSIKGINKHYSKNSLKELVMDLEPRHSDECHLWRNVLWALNQYGRERGYDTLEIADCFSKRSTKYKNFQVVKKTFESSDGTLSLPYLIEISKIYVEGLDAMTKYLNTILPSRYSPLTINRVDIRDRRSFRLNVNSTDESQTLLIIPDLFILGNEDGKRICFLKKTITSTSSAMASLCPEMKKGFAVILNTEHYEFQASNDSSATVILHHPLKPDESFIILPSGKRDNKELHLAEVRKALRAEALKLLSAKSGKKFGDDKDDNDMFIIPDEDSDIIRTDNELVDALIDADPDTMSRYCYSRKTIYYCKPSTNLWCKISEIDLDTHLRKHLKTALKLTKSELRYINMSHAIVRIRNYTMSRIVNLDFAELDSKLHLFTTQNKTIVTSSIPPIIRNIEKEDLAETTCGWSYNHELSKKYMKSVQSYFNKLIPQKCEREWFLSFVARVLNGQRKNSFFLVLTDNCENKNGTSTLMSLLATVFGNYFIANTKIVVAGGIRDHDQYDGGINNLKGKRLLVADKLQKTDTLNCAFIKAITSESNYYIQDKRKFCRTQITFLVQAGLIMTFTADDVPKFDKNDQDFVNRMVAFPMRSRFLSKEEFNQLTQKQETMTHMHIADDSLKLQFPEWSSALLELLRKYYKQSLPPIPDSMVDWKKTLCKANDDYYDWLDSHIRRDADRRSFVTAKNIMTMITKSQEHHPREMGKLKLAMSEWTKKNDFLYKARHVYTSSNRKRVEAKSAIMNSRLQDTDEE